MVMMRTSIPLLHPQPLQLHILDQLLDDRGKGVPSFDEMMDIALVAVDFDDPAMKV